MEKMVNNQIPEVWQEGVDDEGGEEGEAGDDEEDWEDGEPHPAPFLFFLFRHHHHVLYKYFLLERCCA